MQSGLGFLPQKSGRTDLSELYKRRMAQMLLETGANTAPVSGPLEGLARALQAGVGGYMAHRADEDERGKQSAIARELAAAFSPQTAPDPTVAGPRAGTGTVSQPTNDSVVAALLGSSMPEVQQMGSQMRLSGLQKQMETQAALQEYGGKKGIDLQFDPRIAGQTEAAKNPALIERARGETDARNQSELNYKPQIEAALNPILAGRAGLVQDAQNASDLSFKPRIAGATQDAQNQSNLTYQPQITAANETAKSDVALSPAPAGVPGLPVGATRAQAEAAAKATGDKPTDTQRAAAGFAERMTNARQIIDQLEQTKGFNPAGAVTSLARWSGANSAMSADAQRYWQAADNWVRANLRKESGAVIGTDEMAAEIANYFPQHGDSPEVIAQKAANRKQVEENLIRQSGSAAGRSPEATTPERIALEEEARRRGLIQ